LVLIEDGQTGGALDALQQARGVITRLKERVPDRTTLYALIDAAIAKLEVALTLTQKGKASEALVAFQQTHEIIVQLKEQSPGDTALLVLYDAEIATLEQAITAEPGMVQPQRANR